MEDRIRKLLKELEDAHRENLQVKKELATIFQEELGLGYEHAELPNGVILRWQSCLARPDSDFNGYFSITKPNPHPCPTGYHYEEVDSWTCQQCHLRNECEHEWEIPAEPEEVIAGIIAYLKDKLNRLKETITKRNRLIRLLRGQAA